MTAGNAAGSYRSRPLRLARTATWVPAVAEIGLNGDGIFGG